MNNSTNFGSDNLAGGGHFFSTATTGSSCSFTNCSFTGATINGDISSDGNGILFRTANGTFSFNTCTFDNPTVTVGFDKGQEIYLEKVLVLPVALQIVLLVVQQAQMEQHMPAFIILI